MSRGTPHCDSCGSEITSGLCDDCATRTSAYWQGELDKEIEAVNDARDRIAELEREREEARAALGKILAVRENPEPPSLKLFDIYHIAGDALATEVNQRE